jgi:glycosyltransferase involved in cell wall biosynthesis
MNSNLSAMQMKVECPVLQPRDLNQSMVSCVVPAYEEHDNLSFLLPRLQAVLAPTGADWEIIVVDDGSRDATATLMTAWTQNTGFRYVQLSRNFGKEAAITAGIEAAVGDAVLILDADLQHPPELLPEMLSRWQAGVDMIYAVRENRYDESFGKRLGTKLFYSLLKPSRGVVVPPHAGDFRLMDRKVVDALLRLPERNRFMKGLYAWVGFNTEAIQYVPSARFHGDSRFGFLKLIRLSIAGLLSFTTWPLRLVSLIGLLVSICSFGYGIIIVIDYLLYNNPVDGWPTIVTVLLFFSGVNLMSLGIVGEYIAGIFDEVKGRPLYIVRQAIGQAFKNPKS